MVYQLKSTKSMQSIRYVSKSMFKSMVTYKWNSILERLAALSVKKDYESGFIKIKPGFTLRDTSDL